LHWERTYYDCASMIVFFRRFRAQPRCCCPIRCLTYPLTNVLATQVPICPARSLSLAPAARTLSGHEAILGGDSSLATQQSTHNSSRSISLSLSVYPSCLRAEQCPEKLRYIRTAFAETPLTAHDQRRCRPTRSEGKYSTCCNCQPSRTLAEACSAGAKSEAGGPGHTRVQAQRSFTGLPVILSKVWAIIRWRQLGTSVGRCL
jgi:hypothetical protein